MGWQLGKSIGAKAMGRERLQHTHFKAADYDAPTEPVDCAALPPYADAAYGPGSPVPGAFVVPAAQPDARPVYPYYPASQNAAYPLLPPSPLKAYYGQPPGGASSFSPQPQPRRRHRSVIPGLVGVLFLLVQLALLARVVCMLFNVQNTTLWLTLLFAASDLFVQPMRWLAANINISILAGTQLLVFLEFLLAALAYGIFSRLFVRLLKALLNH
jgi:hypothetical protein